MVLIFPRSQGSGCKSFSFIGAMWNNLPCHLTDINNFQSFKVAINSHFLNSSTFLKQAIFYHSYHIFYFCMSFWHRFLLYLLNHGHLPIINIFLDFITPLFNTRVNLGLDIWKHVVTYKQKYVSTINIEATQIISIMPNPGSTSTFLVFLVVFNCFGGPEKYDYTMM